MILLLLRRRIRICHTAEEAHQVCFAVEEASHLHKSSAWAYLFVAWAYLVATWAYLAAACMVVVAEGKLPSASAGSDPWREEQRRNTTLDLAIHSSSS